MLSDQTLFSSNGDLTTKEILKKFSDRASNGLGPRQYVEVTEIMGRHQHEIPSRPPPRRVETDPSQWQQESSVRPVQEPSIPFVVPPQGTPPPKRGPYDAPPPHQSPYRHLEKTATPDGGGSGNSNNNNENRPNNQPREWRNSGWNRQDSGLTTGTV